MYIELTQGCNTLCNCSVTTKRLLPLGSFEVIELADNAAMIAPVVCNNQKSFNDMNWKCVETYQQVRALIAKASTNVYVAIR